MLIMEMDHVDDLAVASWTDVSSFPMTREAIELLHPVTHHVVRWNQQDALTTRLTITAFRGLLYVLDGAVKCTLEDGRSAILHRGQFTSVPQGTSYMEVLSVVPLEFVSVWSRAALGLRPIE